MTWVIIQRTQKKMLNILFLLSRVSEHFPRWSHGNTSHGQNSKCFSYVLKRSVSKKKARRWLKYAYDEVNLSSNSAKTVNDHCLRLHWMWISNFENFPKAELLQDLGYLTRESFHRDWSTVVFDRLRDAVQKLKIGHLEILWLHQKLDFLLRGRKRWELLTFA